MPRFKPLPIRKPREGRIIDGDQIFYSDIEYCELGVRNGWLILDCIRGDIEFYRYVE